jgi:maleate isomerase
VIIPSTNTAVERDYNLLRPDGVTFHFSRMWAKMLINSDEEASSALGTIRETLEASIRYVVTCEPDHLIAGMSSETFMGGVEGSKRFIERAQAISGLSVTTGADASRAALTTLGAKKVAVLTPYQEVIDIQVERYFNELGYEVSEVRGLKVPVATAGAQVPEDTLKDLCRELNRPDVDAIVQAGSNLSVTPIAKEMEAELGKPVIAINVASVWHGLRTLGIEDQIPGYGTLLEDH